MLQLKIEDGLTPVEGLFS